MKNVVIFTWLTLLSILSLFNLIKHFDTMEEARMVQNGDTIAVHYTGKLDNGEVFDSSLTRNQTLDFTVGAGQMIPGFDTGVVGMTVGETKTLTLEPKEAYGERDENNIQPMEVSQLEAAGIPIEIGQKVPTMMGELEIVGISEDGKTVDIDANHFLAGKTLTFEVELVEIK